MFTKAINKIIFILLSILLLYVLFLIIPHLSKYITTLFDIILPFIISFVIAYILQPIVLFFQKIVKKRWISVVIVFIVTIALLFLISKYLVTITIEELEILKNKLPDIIDEVDFLINNIIKKIPFINKNNISIKESIANYLSKSRIEKSIFSNNTLYKLINIIKYVILVPIIIVYLLLDYEKIICSFRNYLEKNRLNRFKDYLGELNQVMSSYFKTIFIVMLILFGIFCLAFTIIGIDNAFIFALIIAITNIIPYLGSYIGTALPVLYALLTSTTKAIIVLVTCVVLQTLEADVLTPSIHGKSIKIHPLLLMLSLLVFGNLFGFFGMLIAVPMAAFLKVTLKYYPIKLYKNKNIVKNDK